MRFCDRAITPFMLGVACMVSFGCDQDARTSTERPRASKPIHSGVEQSVLGRASFGRPRHAIHGHTSASALHSVTDDGALIKRHQRKLPRQKGSLARRLQTVETATAGKLDAFRTPSDCRVLLERGERALRQPGTARIASWNVRWFPDGVPGTPSGANDATDLEWMACALAWMNVDAVALAEIKSRPRSGPAFERITARLSELTDGRYVVRIDDCPDQNGQHVAWLVNEHRVNVTDWQMHASLNPNGDACARQLRPGLGGRFRFSGGLDLHAIAVHFKSGVEPGDLEKRRTSFDALERIFAAITARSGDADVLVAGDFNTMGCRTCPDAARSGAETSWFDTKLKSFRPEARRVSNDLGCSFYFQRRPSLLDHFLVTSAMREAPLAEQAIVLGHCRQLGCEAYSGKEPESALELSDHCPIVLELRDQDLD